MKHVNFRYDPINVDRHKVRQQAELKARQEDLLKTAWFIYVVVTSLVGNFTIIYLIARMLWR